MSEELKTPEERGQELIKRHGENVKELNMDFATFPQWVPDGQGGFRTIIQTQAIDVTPKAVPSNFVEEEK